MAEIIDVLLLPSSTLRYFGDGKSIYYKQNSGAGVSILFLFHAILYGLPMAAELQPRGVARKRDLYYA
ncbi:hypothetical protein KSX_06930 [Ktedonospora formicarum]|uniref:Uncharacterized protein n=1 Tax=Ktedonospora formicarum TaxID=2778364 RepID=A0A8J3MRR0_9CHLR|nr:hypothetical protein KSX_06930 [Ktedonospora formicarum]